MAEGREEVIIIGERKGKVREEKEENGGGKEVVGKQGREERKRKREKRSQGGTIAEGGLTEDGEVTGEEGDDQGRDV